MPRSDLHFWMNANPKDQQNGSAELLLPFEMHAPIYLHLPHRSMADYCRRDRRVGRNVRRRVECQISIPSACLAGNEEVKKAPVCHYRCETLRISMVPFRQQFR